MLRNFATVFAESGQFFAVGLVVFLIYVTAYNMVTRVKEMEEIRRGNIAAALTFMGAALGFVIPLASVIFYSRDLVDMAVWSAVILVIQLAVHFAVRRAIPNLDKAIESGNAADGIFMATISVVVGVLIAASITGFPPTP